MSEDVLTSNLVENLRNGGLRKIIRAHNTGNKIELRREVGNNSFRADIFITMQKEEELRRNAVSFLAIEVKIKDWKQGLYQAWRYQSFAEKSYLAIYEKYAKNIDLSLFQEYNVGLIVFTENTIVVKNQPRKRTFKKSDAYALSTREQILKTLSSVESIQPVL